MLNGQDAGGREPVFMPGGLLRLAVVVVSTFLFYQFAGFVWGLVF